MSKDTALRTVSVLEVEDLSFAYENLQVLEDISFHISKGEHLAVMGVSGCGKSTLFKILYGILPLQSGKIHWGFNTSELAKYSLVPGRAGVKYLAQDFDLMPFTTVAENISDYLSLSYPDLMEQRIRELLGVIDMEKYAHVKVRDLSVGQQQRVALARVLSLRPELLLLDEPFSHIDNFMKNRLRRNLFDYLKAEGITCLTATHDHNDVLPFADRVLVLKDRQIIADDSPLELYDNPKKLYIASLFGEANVVPISIVKSYADTKRRIVVYAHEFKVSRTSGIPVVVLRTYPMGSHYLVKAEAEEQYLYFHSPTDIGLGTEVFLNIPINIINKRIIK